MHNLYNLKTKLIEELESFGEQNEITKSSLEAIDKLAHATKNLIKVMEHCEEFEYSNARDSYANSSRGNSYAMRSYSDGYSRANDDVKNQIYSLMDRVRDNHTKEELRKLAERV